MVALKCFTRTKSKSNLWKINWFM